MRLRFVLLVMIGLSMASCDDDDHHITATVESVQGTTASLRPEDREQTNLKGCFPVTTDDAGRLRTGQCVEVDIPNYLVDENKELPLKSIKVLDRPCKYHWKCRSRTGWAGSAAGSQTLVWAIPA